MARIGGFEPLLNDGQIFCLAQRAVLVAVGGREFAAAEPAF